MIHKDGRIEHYNEFLAKYKLIWGKSMSSLPTALQGKRVCLYSDLYSPQPRNLPKEIATFSKVPGYSPLDLDLDLYHQLLCQLV